MSDREEARQEQRDSGPPRFLTDANFNRRIIVGLRRRQLNVNVLTTPEVNLRGVPDPEVLRYAKELNRILLTHDVNTMPTHFYEFLQSFSEGEHSPGVLAIPQLLPIGAAIEELPLVWAASTHEEWRDTLEFLPL